MTGDRYGRSEIGALIAAWLVLAVVTVLAIAVYEPARGWVGAVAWTGGLFSAILLDVVLDHRSDRLARWTNGRLGLGRWTAEEVIEMRRSAAADALRLHGITTTNPADNAAATSGPPDPPTGKRPA